MNISVAKTKAMEICGKNIQSVKTEIEGTVIDEGSDFNYLENMIS